ncbi:MAG TPA: carboxypeptidase regulatory-like domain-containing protein [Blastocatellia bacterium]|nr:carboxypeptidase regulatory-like domain-containing protein [Blastocatellia bacterium]
MFSTIMKRVVGLSALVMLLSVIASAQTSQIEGNVKIKDADGTMKPVAGALIDIYRLDIKGHWDVKTDKNGHYIRLGLPIQGTYLFVASGPGMQPTYQGNVRISQVPTLDFIGNPGDGSTFTPEQLQSLMKGGGAGTQPATSRAPSAADKAKADAIAKENEAKLKEGKELQANFDAARAHFVKGVELQKASDYVGALAELQQAAAVDTSKHKALLEVAYKANAQMAEAQYQIGADLYSAKKDRNGAKPHFEDSLKSIKKAIELASTATEEPNINNELIMYYNILAKDAKVLVEIYRVNDLVDDSIKSLDKVQAIDTANAVKWDLAKADLYRFADRTEDAVAAYRKVLANDPKNLDALFNIGLALLATNPQESVNALADFVDKAPPTDKRVADAKNTIVAIKEQFKVEAEKPAKRGRKP